MIIILKNIPAKTRKQDIENFIMPFVKGGWLSRSGQITDISIFSQRNLRTRVIHHYGLVEISPDAVAQRVIKKRHRKALVGKHIAVSEYRIRNTRNDRRFNQDKIHDSLKNKRTCDRRDSYEPVNATASSLVISEQVFHGKGW